MDNRQLQLIKDIVGQDNVANNGVIYPQTVSEICQLVKLANWEGIKVYPQGSGSKIKKLPIDTNQGMVISLTKLNKVTEYRPNNMSVEVEAGVTTGQLLELLAKDNIFYPLDTQDAGSTIGGQVATNHYGRKKYMYKSTRFHVLGLEFVSPQGEVVIVGGKTVKNVSGYDISQMLVGSWGTFGIITKVTLRVRPIPEQNLVMDLRVKDIQTLRAIIEEILKERLNLASLTFTQGTDYLLQIELEGFRESLAIQQKLLQDKYGFKDSKGLVAPEAEAKGQMAVAIASYGQLLQELEPLATKESISNLQGNITNGVLELEIGNEGATYLKQLAQKLNGKFIYNQKTETTKSQSPYTGLLKTIKGQVDPNNILFPEILTLKE